LKISVIIVTRNRAKALETISLSSLAKQTYNDFETIVYDASDNGHSKVIIEQFKLRYPSLQLSYFKASRVGLCSQRNDAVKVATGDILFFMDDDCEILEDGLEVLNDVFMLNPDIVGAALPLHPPALTGHSLFIDRAVTIFNKIFLLNNYGDRSHVYLSGRSARCFHIPGYVAMLPGCDMAFLKSVFSKHQFDERLEKFGGYAYNEDQQFTQKLWMEGNKLIIANKGEIKHLNAPGNRWNNGREKIASIIFNQFLVWQTTIRPFTKYTTVFQIWSALGEIILLGSSWLFYPIGYIDVMLGIRDGLSSIVNFRDF
jgi:glycosyltransferase involved in cell wall biosynthesis